MERYNGMNRLSFCWICAQEEEEDDRVYWPNNAWERMLQHEEDYSINYFGPVRATPERPLFSRTPSETSPTAYEGTYEERLGAQLLAEYHAGWE